MSETGQDGAERSRRRWRWRLLVASGVAMVLLGAGGWWLLRSTPPAWRDHEVFLRTHSPEQIETIAKDVETRFEGLIRRGLNGAESSNVMGGIAGEAETVAETSGTPGVRPPDVRIDATERLRLTNAELAAMVTARLDEWMEQRGYVRPAEITDPMVVVEDGRWVLGFRYTSRHVTQVFTADADLRFHRDGTASLAVSSLTAGRVPVPTGAVGEYLQRRGGQEDRAARIGAWLSQLEDVRFKPVLKVEHRRRVRVTGCDMLDDGVELTVRVQDHRTYRETNERLAGVPTPR